MAGKRYVFTHPDLARVAIEQRTAAMLGDLPAPERTRGPTWWSTQKNGVMTLRPLTFGSAQ
jgi:hypothetical protein